MMPTIQRNAASTGYQPPKAEAEKRALNLIKLVRDASARWWLAARWLDGCLTRHDHQALGLNPREYVEKYWAGSCSDAFRKLRISRGLAGLPDKELALLPESNAHALLRLPEGERTKRKYLDMARDMPIAAFAATVAHALNGKLGVQQEAEEWVTWKLSAPKAVFDLWEEAVDRMAAIFDVDLKDKPGRRLMVIEMIARLVTGMESKDIRAELETGKSREPQSS